MKSIIVLLRATCTFGQGAFSCTCPARSIRLAVEKKKITSEIAGSRRLIKGLRWPCYLPSEKAAIKAWHEAYVDLSINSICAFFTGSYMALDYMALDYMALDYMAAPYATNSALLCRKAE